jgi:hypothetical protein
MYSSSSSYYDYDVLGSSGQMTAGLVEQCIIIQFFQLQQNSATQPLSIRSTQNHELFRFLTRALAKYTESPLLLVAFIIMIIIFILIFIHPSSSFCSWDTFDFPRCDCRVVCESCDPCT